MVNKNSMANYELIDNTAEQCYEFRLDGGTARLDYEKISPGEILLTHTEVPPEWQGKGIGSALIEAVLTDIERQGLKIVPLCGFVLAYLERHPGWRRMVFHRV